MKYEMNVVPTFCQSVSCDSSVTQSVWLFVTPWTAVHQAFLSITKSQSFLKLMSVESVMPSSYLCHPLLLPPSIFPSISVFSNESVISFSISPSKELASLHNAIYLSMVVKCGSVYLYKRIFNYNKEKGFPRWLSGKECTCWCSRRTFDFWVEKIWRRERQPTSVFLPVESHGQRSLVGYGPRACKESDTTEWLNWTERGNDGSYPSRL